MSSTVFEVVLRPDPTLRRVVFWSGVVLSSTGIILIALLQVSPFWRVIFSSIWLADCWRELGNLGTGAARMRSLVLDSRGFVAAIDRDGDRDELALLTGSMVLPGLAWIRVRFSSGKCHAELFTQQCAGPETWHRLQLLWHQSREAFGHPPGP